MTADQKVERAANKLQRLANPNGGGEAAARRVGLPMERVMVNIDEYGNTSTATIGLALHDALRQGRLKSGDRVLIAGFGSGLTWGACLLEWE